MTRAEFARVCARVAAWWPRSPWPDDSAAAYFEDLGDFDVAQVATATEALYRDGRDFSPNSAQIRAKLLELGRDDPEWAEVRRQLDRLLRANWGGHHHNIFQASWRPVLEALPAPVAEFAQWCGPRQVYAAFNEQGGGEARLRDKWTSYLQRARRDAALVGLDGHGLAAVERVNKEPHQIGRAALALVTGANEAA